MFNITHYNQDNCYMYERYFSNCLRWENFVNKFRAIRAKCLHYLFTGEWF